MAHQNSPSSKVAKVLLSIVLGATLITTTPLSVTAAPSSPTIFINGQQQSFDQSPVILEGRVYVPVRALLEAFGYEVKWDAYDQLVTAIKKNSLIRIGTHKKFAYFSESSYDYRNDNVPIVIHQGRSMISVRTLSELLGMDIQWDAEKQAVQIDTANNALFDAILNEDLPTVRTLLENGTDPNRFKYADQESSRALRYAIHSGTPSIVQALLDKGAVFEEEDVRRVALSHDAELMNMVLTTVVGENDTSRLASEQLTIPIPYLNAEVAKVLLAHGADPNHKNGEALRGAVSMHHTEMIQDLLKAGADPNTLPQDEDTYPVLIDAAITGSLEIVNLLLAHKADPNIRSTAGWTPLMVAAEHGNIKLIELLLKNGADIHAVNKHGGTALATAVAHGNSQTVQLLLDNGALATPPIELPEAALFHDPSIAEADTYAPRKAAARGEVHKVLKLLQEDKTPHRQAVAQAALSKAVFYGHVELVNMLLASFPDLPASNALYSAVERGNEEIVRALASLRQLQEEKTPYNLELLMVGAGGDLGVYRTLFEFGFKADSTASQSNPLQATAVWGYPEVAKLFVEAGANPNLIDDHLQETVLDTAIRFGHIETLKALLTSHKLTRETTGNALINAVKRNSLDMVKLLLQAEADVHFQTATGQSPMQQAKHNGNPAMIELLTSAGATE